MQMFSMKKWALFAVICLFSFGALCQGNQSVLWKISGKNLTKPSYLFGTIHIVSYKYLDYFPQLKQIIENADRGCFEGTSDSERKIDPNLAKVSFPPLDSVFTTEEYALVDSFFSKTPYGSIKEHNHDASLLGMLQAAHLIKENSDDVPQMSLDEKIIEYMQEDLKKPVFQLDDPNIVMKQVLSYGSPSSIATELVNYIKDSRTSNIDSALNVRLYQSSLTHKLRINEKIPSDNADLLMVFKDAGKRNSLWVPEIIDQMQKGSCFIAVGMGHLQYTTGLIALLKKKGYKLTPVKLDRVQ